MEHGLSPPASDLIATLERMRRLSVRLSRLLHQRLGTTIYQAGAQAAIDEGARHLHEVAEATGQQVSAASRMVERLVQDGLLQRTPDPDDRRAIVLELTPAGRRQLNEARSLVADLMGRALDRMPVDSAAVLGGLDMFLGAAEKLLDEE